MAWTIKLNDDIGYNPKLNIGISSAMFDAMFDTDGAKEAKEIDLIISSYGGSLYEGINMYFRVKREVASGKKIRGIVSGMCASAATLPLIACSEVVAYQGSKFLPHNPYGEAIGDAAAMLDAHRTLLELENEMADIYVTKTGKTFEEVKALMALNEPMSVDAAKDWGFIDTVISFEPKAFATIDVINKVEVKPEKQMEKTDVSALRKLMNAIAKLVGVKAASAPLQDGNVIYFDGDVLAVGTAVFLDEAMTEAAPDGSHILSDGRTIMTVAGVVTEILEMEVEDAAKPNETAEQLAAAQAELVTAQAKIAELTAKLENETVQMKAEFSKMKADFEAKIKATAVGGGDPLAAPAKVKTFAEMSAAEQHIERFKLQARKN